MNVLMIGGSNTVSPHGYVGEFEKHLKEISGISVKINNIAVGGTSIYCGISRFFEVAKGELKIDMVVCEYALNDTGHFNHRQDGELFVRLGLEWLISALASNFPSAKIVIMILSAKPFFMLDVYNKIYDEYIRTCGSAGIQCLDIRKYLFNLLNGTIPDFIYSDDAHYHRGITSGIIGSLLAERVYGLINSQSRSLLDVKKSMDIDENFTKTSCIYLHPKDLVPFTSGPHELLTISNKHMSVDVIRLFPGAKICLREDMIPYSISIKSDINHSFAFIERGGKKVAFSTRYADIIDGKFIYSNVPIPFLLGNSFNDVFTESSETIISTEEKSENLTGVICFDCFINKKNDGKSHFDIAGILCAVR